jgi:hypothetical protein
MLSKASGRARNSAPAGYPDTPNGMNLAPLRRGFFSQDIGYIEPIWHSLLKMPNHRRLGSRDRDRQGFAGRRSEFDNVCDAIVE